MTASLHPVLAYAERYWDKQNKSRAIAEKSDNNNPANNLDTDIPDDLDTFYKNVGFFTNQKTNEPVTSLAPHQIQAWQDRKKSKYRLYLKSQKIGLSTYFLLEDLHVALTYGKGKEIMIISQSLQQAQLHMQDLKKIIRTSAYSKYLIDRPMTQEGLLQDERTKTNIIYLRNPDNPIIPTKIYALGITSPGSLVSFKRIAHIHMSDITLADMIDTRMSESFGGIFSRLANTDGTMIIECPPRGPSGPVYELVEGHMTSEHGIIQEIEQGRAVITPEGFLIRRYTYQVGVNCQMITEEFLDKEKNRLGPLFSMYYEAEFFSGDTTWYAKELIKYDAIGWDLNDLERDDGVGGV